MIPDEFEDIYDPEESDEFEEVDDIDEEEDESDVPAYLKIDKIFNNRYNSGDGLPDSDEYFYSTKITVADSYADSYLRDLYEYEDGLEKKLILDAIFNMVQHDEEISKRIKSSSQSSTKTKLSKEAVNFIFNRISETLELKSHIVMFYSPIYILEVISSISSIEYRKLFDMLSTDIQEMLIIELDKKYNFLDGKTQKKRIH